MESNLTISIALPYLAVLALMYFALTIRVVMSRNRHLVGLGTGKNPEVQKAVRVHGNFAEYVPFVALLLLVLELNMTVSWLVHTFWIFLVLGRVAHAQGISKSAGRSAGRIGGMILTLIPLVGSSITLLVQYFL